MRPRFHETRGGQIIDSLTGLTVARVEVADLDTAAALRVSAAIIAALHIEFGPKQPSGSENVEMPSVALAHVMIKPMQQRGR